MSRSSSPRTLLIEALRSDLLPVLEQAGFRAWPLPPDPKRDRIFERSLPLGYVRRERDGKIDQIDFDFVRGFDPAFDIHLGRYDAAQLSGGTDYVPGEYPVAWLRLYHRLTPRRTRPSARGTWKAATPAEREQLIRQLVSLIPQMEAALRNGEKGPHIMLVDLRDHPPRWFVRPFIALARWLKK